MTGNILESKTEKWRKRIYWWWRWWWIEILFWIDESIFWVHGILLKFRVLISSTLL